MKSSPFPVSKGRRPGTVTDTSRGPLEKDTCRDFVLPLLTRAGWTSDQIQEQFPITAGRIVTVGKKHRRGDALWADYVLEYVPGVPIAVVEAKREYSIPGKGLQQAKNYGGLLDLPLAYSTNGKGIVEDDRDTGKENDGLTSFPTPEEAWDRYRRWKGIVDETTADGVLTPFTRALRNLDGTSQGTALLPTRRHQPFARSDSARPQAPFTHDGHWHGQDIHCDANHLEAMAQRLAAGTEPTNPLSRRPKHPD